MNNQLPTLAELEQMRLKWIKEFINNDGFEDALDVGKHFGDPFEIKFWQGDFYEYKESGFRLITHRWFGNWSPPLGRAFDKRYARVYVGDRLFVNLSIAEPNNEIRDDDIVVPGEWMDILQRLVEKMKDDKSEKDENDDLERRTELAKLLHLMD
jgi:hypothetical protein